MTTETFSISPQQYMRELALAWLGRHWYLPVLPLAAVAIWAFYDLRAIYVGLILVFLIFPMAMSMVWFNYAFSPSALKAVAPKQLTFTDDAIRVDYADDEDRRIAFEPETICRQDIRTVEFRPKYISVIYGRGIDRRLIIGRAVLTDNMLNLLQTYSSEASDVIDAF